MIRSEDVLEFDIIVNDAPVSANQKEASWAIPQQMLPILLKQPLSIKAWAKPLKASPLPGSVVGEFVDAVQQDQQKQRAEEAQQTQLMQEQTPDPWQLRVEAELKRLEVEAALKQRDLEERRAARLLQKMHGPPPGQEPSECQSCSESLTPQIVGFLLES